MRENSIIKANILEYLDSKGISKYECYKHTGISNGVLSQNGGMSEDNTLKFLSYYTDVNTSWLLTGKGSMLKSDYGTSEPDLIADAPNSTYLLRTDRILDNQKIPLYNIEAFAGLVPLFENQNETATDEYIMIPNLPRCDGAVFVSGDSMYPLLKSGDIVAYKQIVDFSNDIFWGEMYLVSINVDDEEYISVKYVQKSDKGDAYIKLVSQNQHHQPKDVLLTKVRAMAIVKASIRINTMR